MSISNLQLTDGTTTVQLDSSGSVAFLGSYQGRSESTSYVPRATSLPENGDWSSIDLDDPRNALAESFVLTFKGGTTVAQGNLTTVKQLLAQAGRRRTNKAVPAVYAQFRARDTDAYSRSELLGGTVQESERTFGPLWANGVIEARISWIRRPYLEDAEVQLPLTNGNGTNNISGLTVWNHDDGDAGHDNYVEIAASAITGDLPAPIRYEFVPGAAYRYVHQLLIAHNVYGSPSTFTHMLEYTGSVDATASAANYRRTSIGTGYTEFGTTLFSEAQLAAMGGNYYRVIARFNALPPSGITAYFQFTGHGQTPVLYRSAPVEVSSTFPMQILGTAQFPPSTFPSFAARMMFLELYAKRPAGAANLDLDYVFLVPLDSYRLITVGKTSPVHEVADDMISDYRYSVKDVPEAVPDVTAIGASIMLVPNRLQRLYFLKPSTGANVNAIADTATVKVYYRPRRLSL